MATSKLIKKELILETAFQFFIEKGYMETRIIDIAEACGMGKGTFYEYFDSKEALFGEIFQKHVQDVYTTLPELLAQEDLSCREQLQTFVRFEADIALKYGNQKNFVDHLMNQVDVVQNKDLQETIQQFLGFRFALVLNILKKGIENGELKETDPILAASIFLGALCFYFSFHYGLLSEDSPLEQFFNAYASDLDNMESFDAVKIIEKLRAFKTAKSTGAKFAPPPMEDFFNLVFTGLAANN